MPCSLGAREDILALYVASDANFLRNRRQVKTQMLRFADLKWHVASIFDDASIAVADRAAFGEAQTIFGNLSDELIAFGQSAAWQLLWSGARAWILLPQAVAWPFGGRVRCSK